MTTLEYFMSHAPAEPQAWFEPVMAKEPPIPPTYPQGDEAFDKANSYYMAQFENWGDKTTLYKWSGDAIELTRELKDRVEAYQNDLNGCTERTRWYVSEREKQRLLQWPLAWAQEMVQRLPKEFRGTPSMEEVLMEQRDQCWADDQQVRKIIGADENKSTVDEVSSLVLKYLTAKESLREMVDAFADRSMTKPEYEAFEKAKTILK